VSVLRGLARAAVTALLIVTALMVLLTFLAMLR
jgi:hypothetical protein